MMDAKELADRLQVTLGPLGLRVTTWPGSDVVNINTTAGESMTRMKVDAFRRALQQSGFEEVESWVPMQGVSWLSGGVPAGVSFRVRPEVQ